MDENILNNESSNEQPLNITLEDNSERQVIDIDVTNQNVKVIEKKEETTTTNRTGNATKLANLVVCKEISGSLESSIDYVVPKLDYENFLFKKDLKYIEANELTIKLNHEELLELINQSYDEYIKNAEVIVDKTNFTIVYQNNKHLDLGQTEISGSLTLSKYLKEFSINTEKRYQVVELRKLLRRNKRFMPSGEFMEWDMALANYNAQTNQSVDNKDNLRGATQKNLVRNTVTNLPEYFTLTLPIFTDSDNTTFRVEVYVDDQNSNLFYLDSIDLYSLIDAEAEHRMNTIIENFAKLGIAIIYK